MKFKSVKLKNEGKIEYLQMIQSAIDRMATTSAIFKGFSATIVAGISMIAFNQIKSIVLIGSFLPVISFFLLDLYYLNLEKRFRYLYEKVRKDEKEIDFSMVLPSTKLIKTEEQLKNKKLSVGFWACIKSPSIALFYPLLIIIEIVVVFLKLGGQL